MAPKRDTMKDKSARANADPSGVNPHNGGSSSAQGGSDNAEVLGTIRDMMKGFMNNLSRALKGAASGSANQGEPNNRLLPEQPRVEVVIEQEYHNPLQPEQPRVEVVVEQEYKGIMVSEENDELAYVSKFHSLKPPTFDGLGGPKAAEDWLYRIKECLDAIAAPKKFRVNIAALKLTDHAYRWFHTVKNFKSKKWFRFERFFLNEYLPEAYRRAKRDRQRWLTQGDMSVEEYRIRFEELSSYKDFHATNETEKMEQFYNGLNLHYRRVIGFTRLNSYRELVDFAIMFDNQYGQTRHLEGATKVRRHKRAVDNRRGAFRKNKKFRRDCLESSGGNMTCSESSGGPRLGCFFCGSEGHYRKDCLLKVRDNQQPSRGGNKKQGRGQTSRFRGRAEVGTKNKEEGKRVALEAAATNL